MRLVGSFILFLFVFQFAFAQQQTIGLFTNDSLALNGYTLWSPNKSTYMIDNCGYLVKQWDSNVRPGLSVYLLENGNLLRTGSIGGSLNGAGSGGRIEEFNWDGELQWTYDVSSPIYQQHHDIEPLPNGNILVIAWELKTVNEVIEAGASNARIYWSEAIFELEKIGTNDAAIVWEWHMWDHLIQDIDSSRQNFGIVANHPELLDINYTLPPLSGVGGGGDWLHFNAIDYDANRDEILLSSRTHNEIYIIDHSTTTEEAAGHVGGIKGKGGDLIYRWGNPEAYDRGTNIDKKLFGQHNVEIIPEDFPGAGNLTIFNNGSGRPDGPFSSIEEIIPPRDEDGNYIIIDSEPFGPPDPVWQYIAPIPEDFYSNNMAGSSRLKNGNTIICEANQGTFFEVTEEGEIVWLYQNTLTNNGPMTQGSASGSFTAMTFRVSKYPTDYPAFEGRDLIPGNPIELNPIPYECEIFDETTTSNSNLIADGELNVTFDISSEFISLHNNTDHLLSIHLLDIQGKVVDYLYTHERNFNFNISNAQSGMYILLVNDSITGQFKSTKIIKI